MACREKSDVARIMSALPAAGAYDATGTSIPCNQYDEITFLIKYQTPRGQQTGGGVTYKIEWSLDNLEWYQIAEVQAPILTPGADIVDATQRVEVNYVATSTAEERFMSPNFDIAANFVRILCKETVNIGAPGVVGIHYFMNGEVS